MADREKLLVNKVNRQRAEARRKERHVRHLNSLGVRPGRVLDRAAGAAGRNELLTVVPSADGARGVCLFKSDSVDTVRNLVDGAAGAISSNEFHAVDESRSHGLPLPV